jgi:hypothetical protein
MFKFLKKDSHFFGVAMGLLLPILAYGLFYLLNQLVIGLFGLDVFMREYALRLLSISVNLIPLRFYFISKRDQTGRGVLFVFMIYALVYFFII